MRTRLLALTAVLPLMVGAPAACAAAAGPAAPTMAASGAAAGPAAPTVAASGPCGRQATAPAYKHVIWIWMENHSYYTFIGSPQAPYINSLAT